MGSAASACAAQPSPVAAEEVKQVDNGVAPAVEDSSGKVSTEILDNAGEITKEKFKLGLQRILALTIEGYPRAIRSIPARRNELLRQTHGDQEAAVDVVKERAAAVSEEGKTWMLGLVPYVGLPASILYPTWTLLRRVCMIAGIYGHDLNAEEVRAKIIGVFAKMRSVPIAEWSLECAAQAVWNTFAGPVASVIPVGAVVSKVANIEGHVMAVLGKETFEEGRRVIPESEYLVELDAEPTSADYAALAKDGLVYAAVQSWETTQHVGRTVADAKKREEIFEAAKKSGVSIVDAAKAISREAISSAPGAAAATTEKVKAAGNAAIETGVTAATDALKAVAEKAGSIAKK